MTRYHSFQHCVQDWSHCTIFGPSYEIDSCRQLLERCRQKKIFLARHKLEAGEQVDFAGVHIGGPLGYRPVQSKLDATIKLKHPENITELRSFVGMVNQLRQYMPDFHHSMSNLQKLMKKDAHYIWDDEKHADFDQIKEMLKSPLGLKPFNRDWRTIL